MRLSTNSLEGQLALELFDSGVITVERPTGEKLDTLLAPLHVDMSKIKQDQLEAAAERLSHLAEYSGLAFDRVAGLPNTGDLLAEAFVRSMPHGHAVPLVKLSKTPAKGDQRAVMNIVSGGLVVGNKVLVINPVIDVFDTVPEDINQIEGFGAAVYDVLVLVDLRQEDPEEGMMDEEPHFTALFAIDQLLDLYLAEHRIDEDTRACINLTHSV